MATRQSSPIFHARVRDGLGIGIFVLFALCIIATLKAKQPSFANLATLPCGLLLVLVVRSSGRTVGQADESSASVDTSKGTMSFQDSSKVDEPSKRKAS